MKETVLLVEDEFDRELRNLPVSAVKLILEAVDAMPQRTRVTDDASDGTAVNRDHGQEATPDTTPQSSPTESTPGGGNSRVRNMLDRDTDEGETRTTTSRRTKDRHAEAKEFLTKYGPLVLRRFAKSNQELDATFETARSRQRAEYQGNEVDEMKSKLTLQIKKFLCQVAATETKTNFFRLRVAAKLIQLLGEFRKNSKPKREQYADFIRYIEAEFGMKQASFYLHKRYYLFVNDYQRFKECPASFTAICAKMKMIHIWFDCETAQVLPATDYLSPAYWRQMPNDAPIHNFDTIKAVEVDDEELLVDHNWPDSDL